MSIRLLEILVLLLAFAPLALMLWVLIDLSGASDEQLSHTGFHRYAWLGLVILVPLLGSIVYLVAGRPRFRQAADTAGGQVASGPTST